MEKRRVERVSLCLIRPSISGSNSRKLSRCCMFKRFTSITIKE